MAWVAVDFDGENIYMLQNLKEAKSVDVGKWIPGDCQ